MKRISVLVLLLIVSLRLFAQDVSSKDKSEINQRLKEYQALTNKGDWTGLMDYIYPGLFSLMPKENMAAAFSSLGTMGIEMSMQNMKIKSYTELGEIGEERFVAVPYSTNVYMSFSGEALSMISLMEEQFKVQFGEGNVTFEEDKNRFKLFQEKTMLGIYVEEQGDWFFIDYDDEKEEMFSTIIPTEILKKLKELD